MSCIRFRPSSLILKPFHVFIILLSFTPCRFFRFLPTLVHPFFTFFIVIDNLWKDHSIWRRLISTIVLFIYLLIYVIIKRFIINDLYFVTTQALIYRCSSQASCPWWAVSFFCVILFFTLLLVYLWKNWLLLLLFFCNLNNLLAL